MDSVWLRRSAACNFLFRNAVEELHLFSSRHDGEGWLPRTGSCHRLSKIPVEGRHISFSVHISSIGGKPEEYP